jgi:site-specific DNA-methyltransferase (adenine-specific)
MIKRGWILRNEVIWWKPNCMPSSAKDRFTVDFEKLFFFVKSQRYYFQQQFEEPKDRARLTRPLVSPATNKKRVYGDEFISALNPKTAEASRLRILRQGRNKRCVWSIATRPYRGRHFAVYPPQLIETPIKAGCPKGGIVLDPFIGSGTTALVAQKLGRNFIGIDLNSQYVQLAKRALRSSR